MMKLVGLAVAATIAMSAPAFARGGGQGLNVNAAVLTGKGGVLGLLSGRGGLVVDTQVTTGKGGVLGAVLGRGGLLGGLLGGGGCGCH
ncbi:hypothetical protein X566_24050 [Afipia sp. P52-10]|uniref:hypothetical protein n=1 Tax=Afipia sp. P52-10 TaxID=1429916 RepID=UPI0003DF1F87|nr:hypothetical protein [Afipia sp. P52-10]ETR75748.1 hypothetical protein X566_24050 [Afipia sp. P52-10]